MHAIVIIICLTLPLARAKEESTSGDNLRRKVISNLEAALDNLDDDTVNDEKRLFLEELLGRTRDTISEEGEEEGEEESVHVSTVTEANISVSTKKMEEEGEVISTATSSTTLSSSTIKSTSSNPISVSVSRELANGTTLLYGEYADLFRKFFASSSDPRIYQYASYAQLATPFVVLLSTAITSIMIAACLCACRLPPVNIRWYGPGGSRSAETKHDGGENGSAPAEEETPPSQDQRAQSAAEEFCSVDEVEGLYEPVRPLERADKWAKEQTERLARRQLVHTRPSDAPPAKPEARDVKESSV